MGNLHLPLSLAFDFRRHLIQSLSHYPPPGLTSRTFALEIMAFPLAFSGLALMVLALSVYLLDQKCS
jgi:hypothetical protein